MASRGLRKRNLRHVYDLSLIELEHRKQAEKHLLQKRHDPTRFLSIPDYLDAVEMLSNPVDMSRHFRGRSTFLQLTTSNVFRRKCINILKSPLFEAFILFSIIVNSIFVALDNPLHRDEERLQLVIYISDVIFAFIFTAEMIIKVTAFGFVNNGAFSYIRNPWNVIDFVVVIMSYPFLFGIRQNFSSIRLVRVLRPLRSINGFEGVRLLVVALIKALPLMWEVFLLLVLGFLLLGIAGMQLFGGKFRQRCYFTETGILNEDREFLCPLTASNSFSCPEDQFCAASAENPNFGVTGFDNIFQAFLTVIQCVSLEGWVDVMYFTFETLSYWTVLYFILLLLVGSFFIINLVDAILCAIYQREKDALLVDEQLELETQIRKRGSSLLNRLYESEPQNISFSQRHLRRASKASRNFISWIVQLLEKMSYPINVILSEKSKKRISKVCSAIADHSVFQNFIVASIIVNVALMASEHFQQPEYWSITLETTNYFFTALFTVEAVVKVCSHGWRMYFRDRFNVFDFVVVFISYVEIILTEETSDSRGGGFRAFRAFRIFRVLRIFKLSKNWSTLQSLVTTILKSSPKLFHFSLLLFLFVFIFALFGMQVFAGKLKESDGAVARFNFDTFAWSLVSVFSVLTCENWNEAMNIAINSTSSAAAIYYVALLYLGHYILLGLFLAIILSEFSSSNSKLLGDENSSFKASKAELEPLKAKGDIEMTPLKLDHEIPSKNIPSMDRGDSVLSVQSFKGKRLIRRLKRIGSKSSITSEEEVRKNYVMQGNSLFVFSPSSQVRQFCTSVVTHPFFETCILFFIMLSTLVLAFDAPALTKDKQLDDALTVLNIIFSVIFIVEALLKVISMGFIIGSYTYLKDSWNVIDFLVVISSIVDLITGDFAFFKAFRAFRALRPLRLVRRLQQIRIAVMALIQAVPNVINVLMLLMLFNFVFGIIGVQLWNGLFYGCEDGDFMLVPSVDQVNCNGEIGTWRNPRLGNFDNIFNAVLILFEVSSLEMWQASMLRAIDTSEIAEAPIRDNNKLYAIFFIIFIVVSNFYLSNLFVGVVISTFKQQKESLTGAKYLTKKQKLYIQVQKLFAYSTGEIIPTRPSTDRPLKRMVFDLIQHWAFDQFIIACIILNTIVMAMWYYDQSDILTWFQFIANLVFTFIFIVEAGLKIFALGFHLYWSRNSNKFDFVIVIGSVIGLLVRMQSQISDGFDSSDSLTFEPTLLRLFRILRILRLVDRLSGLKNLVQALQFSLPSMLNIGSLMFLLSYVYAVIGVALFAGFPRGEFLSVHANFDNVPSAMLVLLIVLTGEQWNGIMHDVMYADDCGEAGPIFGDTCGSVLAVPYFTSFVILGSIMLLNLFVAIILEHFESQEDAGDSSTLITLQDLNSFNDAWRTKGLRSSWWNILSEKDDFCSSETFECILAMTNYPLGLKARIKSRMNDLLLFKSLDLHLYRYDSIFDPSFHPEHDPVYVINKFEALVALVHHAIEEQDVFEHIGRKKREKFKHFASLRVESFKTTNLTVATDKAAQICQAWWRGKQTRRRLLQEHSEHLKYIQENDNFTPFKSPKGRKGDGLDTNSKSFFSQ